ncbi:serine/threonine-protein phosphatase [Streptomyces bambusae]|uniref:PP2C family protein-serine/threonine phosphatase n=1 Tax=Streptomyces bambusae TaxID=1550616 RepID=UPI001CFC8A48|nr:PP2C family protein-serine/threonine phosphatase [Streptomyces bambusae]MCB5167902.1 serine/threonine-protein phosphatase [Streptomyces bambusae]
MDPRSPTASRHRPRTQRRARLAVPFALIVVVTVADLISPAEVHLGPFLAAAPALTASFRGPRATALVGAVALLAQTLVAGLRTEITDLNHTVQISALLVICVFVTLFAHFREVRERELTQLRSVAEAAQRVVLRPLRDRIGPLRVASVYLAAEAEAEIGGDLYAAARTARGTRLIIGDVRGKGLEAVGDAALVLGAFRAAAHREADLPGLIAFLEGTVSEDREDAVTDGRPAGHGAEDPAGRVEAFTTVAVLDIPDDGPALHLLSCGHPPPLVLREGRIRPLEVDEPAPPLGLTEFVTTRLRAQTFPFGPGDLLLLYTDGVIEARDTHGRFYPLADRLAGAPRHSPQALLDHLCADLLAHAAGGSLGDDAAMVAIERLPAGPGRGGPGAG